MAEEMVTPRGLQLLGDPLVSSSTAFSVREPQPADLLAHVRSHMYEPRYGSAAAQA